MSALTWAVAAVVSDDTGRVLLCRQGRGERRYALPGGRLRPAESPVRAALRDIRAETGWEIELVDLVGVYHLTGPTGQTSPGRAGPLPDVLVHVFRARAAGVRPAADPPPGCRLSWHSPDALPESVTPLTRAAVTDARAGRSGVLHDVSWTPGVADPGRPTTDDGGRSRTGQGERSEAGQGAGAGQPPEQRGEAADPSLHR
ncbi:ADP-ribose pyrophosphatase YjhB (NUDIX family) [Micromonospora jinlongensis]|uniref:ADP-ribose pyrophosphatase YjhB (NUDIX family) n=1 Tax=Micromonospora jinlongensis TaxID=1287877 RepID=A0A7Y9WZS9_9ACTN|nr:NUDIX hydrolase [Micromonospora jinlongensis]NYH42348.1 ADP-ribose pyrophosphatase YjhB (NUDIX family) [Micromonospora jinlongensis]